LHRRRRQLPARSERRCHVGGALGAALLRLAVNRKWVALELDSRATDFTIPEHGERRGLPHVGIELREDLISAEAG
jgi:hypothetical protein